MKIKQLKLRFNPSQVSFTVGSNKNLAEIRATAARGTDFFELDDVLTTVLYEGDGGVDPEPEPEPEPEPDPDDGLIYAPVGERHVYSQLQVFNNSMNRVLTYNGDVYTLFSFPEMEPIMYVGGQYTPRWYGTTLFGVTETGVTNLNTSSEILTIPNGDTVWQGGSYEDIGAGTLALINDARDRLYLMKVSSLAQWSFALTGSLGGNNINTAIVSPRGNYVVLVFNDVGDGPTKGMCLYSLQGQFMKQITKHHNHFDLGVDPTGKEFLVTVDTYVPGAATEQSIVKHYLDDSTTERIFDVPNKDNGKWDVVGHVTSRALYKDVFALDTEQYVYCLTGPTYEVTARYPLLDVQPGYDNQPHPSLSVDGKFVAFKDGGRTVFGSTDV